MKLEHLQPENKLVGQLAERTPTLKIAHVTATFPPYHGGTGNVCYYNARELARLGHNVHVFTAAIASAPAVEMREGFTIHRLKPIIRVGNAPILPTLLTELGGFDVIHLHYPFFGGEITTLAAKLSQTPLVITYHQDVFLSGLMGVIAKTMRLTVGRLTLRAAARLLFTSLDYGQASYVRPMLHGRENFSGALSNGVDTSVFCPGDRPADLLVKHNLQPSDHIALLVAGLDRAHYFKGVNVFLAALAKLPADVKGVIVGDGDLRLTYEAQARELGLDGRVIFAGRVAAGDLPDYYRLAHVTVLPSVTMGEAFGLVLIEALASATPVIASALPGVRSVVNHGVDGLLVAPNNAAQLADALEQILADKAHRRIMGEKGRVKVEQNYTWAQIGKQLEIIYQQVLQREVEA